MRFRYRKELAALLCGLLISLIVVEIAFRLGSDFLKPHPPRSDRPQNYFVAEASRSPRDYRYEQQKPADSFRISVLGDSFTFGTGILFDDSFPKRLERILNLNLKQPKVEVLNFGVPGYSSKNESALLKDVVSKYQSDLIVLQITLNDPEISPYRFQGGPMQERMGKFRKSGGIYDYWHSLGFIAARLNNWKSRQEYQDYFTNLFRKPDTLQNFKSSITEMAQWSAQNNTILVAVVFPLFTFPLNGNYPFFEAHKIIAETLSQQQVDFLDLFDNYRNMNPERLQTEPGVDPHPSETAHRIAAESIFKWLREKNLIPELAAPNLILTKRESPAVLK